MEDMPTNTNTQTVPWWATWGLACVVLAVFSAMSGLIIWRTADTSQYANGVVMAVFGLVSAATGYYFGSSSGSEKKDSTIAGTAAALATSAPVQPAPAVDNVNTSEADNAALLLGDKLGAAQP